MTLPFNLSVGDFLDHDAGQRLRFDSDLGGGLLRITDVRTAGPLQVVDSETGALVAPTVDWLRQEHAAGRLKAVRAEIASAAGCQRDLSGCDTDACEAIDPKAPWRQAWTEAAVKADPVKTDEGYKAFIGANAERIHAALNERREAIGRTARSYGSPRPSTLRRWVREAPDDYAPDAFVSRAGRAKGQSQLSPADDRMVHDAAHYYWGEPKASIRDAYTVLVARWMKANGVTEEGGGEQPPGRE